ncbi:hypothetical protein BN8_03340 [Fibrisoma limi BUZ 3]|uniref:DUF4440 domain-containing protein n=1 Tax=Fibrisoma limi BUZ 3 TaxID=1185876 RepID=I2GJW9_9BACT|nr:nuclear transport factor 2 family protein [Fibrisoma limi]CCH54194.1 hypothetical protein BN8_03340 [Fibrisoma limi BUZ 3]
MKIVLVLIATLGGTMPRLHGQTVSQAIQAVEAVEREITEALVRRDRATLDRLLAEGFTFIHGFGKVDTRQEYLELAAAGRLARQRADLKRINEPLRIYGNHTAIRFSRTIFYLKALNREDRGLNTAVYVKVGGQWQLASSQSTKLPDRPKAVAINPTSYRAMVGVYQIDPNRVLTISQAGDTLIGNIPFRPRFELIPQSDTTFIQYSDAGGFDGTDELIFRKDQTGRTIHAAYRVGGQEGWRAEKIK